MAGRMPWHIEHLQADSRRLDDISLSNQRVRRWARDRHAEGSTQVGVGIGQQVCFLRTDDEWSLRERLFEGAVAADMIPMAVGVEQRGRRQFPVAEEIQNQIGLQAGIEHECILAVRQPDHVAILLKGHRHQRLNLKGARHTRLSPTTRRHFNLAL